MAADELERLPDLREIDIKKYIKDFKGKNKTSEAAVRSVFAQYNNNMRVEDVLIKVMVINSCYNTRLNNNPISRKPGIVNHPVDVQVISEHIFSHQNEIARYVEDKDKIGLIENLKKVDDEYKMAYSFVTKYFSWEYPDMDIYMFDRYVKGLLYSYNKKIQYTDRFTHNDLDNYKVFCSVYDAFFAKLKKVNNWKFKNTREKDMFLWMFSKSLED